MEIKEVKEFLDLKGVLEDSLFAYGSVSKKSTKNVGSAFGAVYGSSIAEFYAFTLLEGALAITPFTKAEILIDEIIRIRKDDVDKITIKRSPFGSSLEITSKDNKRKVYKIKKFSKDLDAIIKKLN